jgi:hypothetical protein
LINVVVGLIASVDVADDWRSAASWSDDSRDLKSIGEMVVASVDSVEEFEARYTDVYSGDSMPA